MPCIGSCKRRCARGLCHHLRPRGRSRNQSWSLHARIQSDWQSAACSLIWV